jgi:hypothetical protein
VILNIYAQLGLGKCLGTFGAFGNVLPAASHSRTFGECLGERGRGFPARVNQNAPA